MSNNLQVLVVDDEPNVAFTFQAALARLDGIDVEMSTNPQEALLLCQQKRFDLLMTDYMMPEMDGLELVAAVREFLPNIKVLIVSAIKQGALKDEAAAAGIKWVRYKPLKFHELREIVVAILDDTAVPDSDKLVN